MILTDTSVAVTIEQAKRAADDMERYLSEAESACGDKLRFREDRIDLKSAVSCWSGRVSNKQLESIVSHWKASVDRRRERDSAVVR